jgi:MFS superfamily sulfate permease-like transporter
VTVLALIVNQRAVWLYAVATLTLAGLAAYPAFFTGDQAAHALRGTWYVVPAMVKEHDEAAGYALTFLLVTGAVSAYTWWRMVRRDTMALIPVWLRVVVFVVAGFTLSVVVRTAYLGGQIIHDSPKLATPPGPTR